MQIVEKMFESDQEEPQEYIASDTISAASHPSIIELVEREETHTRNHSNDYFSCEEDDDGGGNKEENLDDSRDHESFVETAHAGPKASSQREAPHEEDPFLLTAADFVMDAATLMWSFSHAMYLVGSALCTGAEEIQQIIEDPAYYVTEAINDDASGEVRCNVFESEDRVVVAFSFTFRPIGTPTNALVEHTPPLLGISAGAPGDSDIEAEDFGTYRQFLDRRDARVQGPLWDRYLRVRSKLLSSMRELHSERPRPVYGTGHSGGGGARFISRLRLEILP